MKHASNLFKYENEELPKIGDKFDSLDSFRLYIDGKAKEWKYYLKCADSHRKNGKDTFVYKCVFARPRSAVTKAKGLRKRTRRVPIHDCPCRVLLKPVPSGAKDLTVVYVCNHHDHPLIDDYFHKLQHGRRLHPNVKEEIMDLLSLDVDKEVAQKYFELLTGYTMSYGYFANMLMYMKKNKIERQFSLEKLKEMSKKIDKIKEELGITDQNENKGYPNNNLNLSYFVPQDMRDTLSENVDNKSRLVTRLQQLHHDEETLQNIKHIQDSIRNEYADKNVETSKRNTCHKSKRRKNTQREVNSYIESSHQQIEETFVEIMGASKGFEAPQSNKDISYECEIAVGENNAENEPEYTFYESNVLTTDLKSVGTGVNVQYCIQSEDNRNSNEPVESCIVLEDLENVPLRIQATELATINVLPDDSTVTGGIASNSQIVRNQEAEPPIKHEINNIIEEIEQPSLPEDLNLRNNEYYEIIETNNKKILPNRDFVHSNILNKPKVNKIYKHQHEKTIRMSKLRYDKKTIYENNVNAKIYKHHFRKKRRPKKRNEQFHSDEWYSSHSSEEMVKKGDPVDPLLQYGVVLNELKDDEYYLIVVDNFKEKCESSADEGTGIPKLLDHHITTDDDSRDSKLEESIEKLRYLKQSLKLDVDELIAAKKKLLEEIAEAKAMKKVIVR
ncbi:unnamed protein product [Diatraea saccharalis]|uniref:FAR1 domain-containing protein n=1 Tax=Diatraea saccharalis TaxID=40085 RepID=A0A9P0C7L7_9NEOP|nr:unnamed protein product [Diatraea saccharalis]